MDFYVRNKHMNLNLNLNLKYVYTLHCIGSGFLQYTKEEELNSAITGIRGINLGGRLLLLQKVCKTDVEELLMEQYVCPQYIYDG